MSALPTLDLQRSLRVGLFTR